MVNAAVIGAGRMGSVVTKMLPGATNKIIIDKDVEKAKELAQTVKGTCSESLEMAKDADLIFVVLPTPVVHDTVAELIKHVKDGAAIINMATTAHISPDLLAKREGIHIVDAKILGHAMSISRGEPAILVLNTKDEKLYELLKEQLTGFEKVEMGNSDLV